MIHSFFVFYAQDLRQIPAAPRMIKIPHQQANLLDLVRNADPGGAHGKTVHFRAFVTPPCAPFNTHIQLAQGPVFLSQEKVQILSEYRMYRSLCVAPETLGR